MCFGILLLNNGCVELTNVNHTKVCVTVRVLFATVELTANVERIFGAQCAAERGDAGG